VRGRHDPGLPADRPVLAQIRAALAEAITDGRVPGPNSENSWQPNLRREVTGRISELDHLLGAPGG